MNTDGLDIPEFLKLAAEQRKAGWQAHGVRYHQRRQRARDRNFKAYAIRKARRRRAKSEWR